MHRDGRVRTSPIVPSTTAGSPPASSAASAASAVGGGGAAASASWGADGGGAGAVVDMCKGPCDAQARPGKASTQRAGGGAARPARRRMTDGIGRHSLNLLSLFSFPPRACACCANSSLFVFAHLLSHAGVSSSPPARLIIPSIPSSSISATLHRQKKVQGLSMSAHTPRPRSLGQEAAGEGEPVVLEGRARVGVQVGDRAGAGDDGLLFFGGRAWREKREDGEGRDSSGDPPALPLSLSPPPLSPSLFLPGRRSPAWRTWPAARS